MNDHGLGCSEDRQNDKPESPPRLSLPKEADARSKIDGAAGKRQNQRQDLHGTSSYFLFS